LPILNISSSSQTFESSKERLLEMHSKSPNA
jgi:hypothetical protein